MTNADRIADLKRRLANARKRAAYASGRPNWGNRGYRGNTGRGDELYELAMCDVNSLAGCLEAATSRKFKRSDPKQAFRESFGKLLNAVTGKKAALALKPKEKQP